MANEIGNWIQDNKPIFIPVVVVVGLLILVAIASCCYTVLPTTAETRAPTQAAASVGGWNSPSAFAPLPPPHAGEVWGRRMSPPVYQRGADVEARPTDELAVCIIRGFSRLRSSILHNSAFS